MTKNWQQRMDTFLIGFICGLLFPCVVFVFYWLIRDHQIPFPERYIRYLLNGNLLSAVIKICGLGNLLLFYLAINRQMNSFSKGVVVSLVIYVALIAYVTYYHEPEYH